jgi:hypothetical protein
MPLCGLRWVKLRFSSVIVPLLSLGLNLATLKTEVPANEQYCHIFMVMTNKTGFGLDY